MTFSNSDRGSSRTGAYVNPDNLYDALRVMTMLGSVGSSPGPTAVLLPGVFRMHPMAGKFVPFIPGQTSPK